MTLKDLDYVISVLKGETPKTEPDWYSVTGFLICNRVAGLFYKRAAEQAVILPVKVKKILGDIFEKQKRRAEFMRGHIDELTVALADAGAAHMTLKGSVLTNLSERRIYADGERTSNDIDILVKPDRITAATDALNKLGCVQGEFKDGRIKEFTRLEILKRRMNRGEVAPFVKLTGDKENPFIEVDVNFSLGNTPSENRDLLCEMIDNAEVYSGKARVSVPDEELFFLHLIMHQYKESRLLFTVERGKDLDLYKLADIYYLLKADIISASRISGLIKKYGLENEVGAVLSQVGEVFKDKQILSLTKGAVQPEVKDYDNKKTYGFTASVRRRICKFSGREYLKGVNLW